MPTILTSVREEGTTTFDEFRVTQSNWYIKLFGRWDVLLLLVATTIYWIFLQQYRFFDQLSEWDLYLAAIGLWDGYRSGNGLASTIHYGKSHSFGYIQVVYLLASSETFEAGYGLFRLMNAVGFWSSLACLPLMWIAIAIGYGRRVAWPATIIFIGSPIFLEIAGGAHPMLLALATVLVGAILLWIPARGPLEIGLRLLAAIILVAALTIRFEVVLAFPFLVLIPLPREKPLPSYARGLLARLIVTTASTTTFFIVRAQVVPGKQTKTEEFFTNWYSLDNIPIGLVALTFAVGLGSLIALMWAMARAFRNTDSGNLLSAFHQLRFRQIAAPLAMVAVVFCFWIANPLPARHFLLISLGAAIIIAVAATQALSAKSAVLMSLLLVGSNQLFSASLNSLALKASGYSAHRDWPYLLTSPSGFAWERRTMLKDIWGQSIAAGENIAAGRCGKRLIVSAQLAPALIAAFYAQGKPVQTSTLRLQHDGDVGMQVENNSAHVIIHTRNSLRQPSIPTAVIHEPKFAKWNLMVVSPRKDGSDQRLIPASRYVSEHCIG